MHPNTSPLPVLPEVKSCPLCGQCIGGYAVTYIGGGFVDPQDIKGPRIEATP